MSEIKLSLNIKLPGRIMMSEQECSKNPKENYTFHKLQVEDKKGKETIKFKTRNCHEAGQIINICKEAYEYMTAKAKNKKEDAQYCPVWTVPEKWFPLSKQERLEAHLKRMADHLGGTSYSYQVFDD